MIYYVRLYLSLLLCGIACTAPAMAADAPSIAAANTVPTAAVDPEPSPLADYKLGIADKVRVLVFNEEALSGEFTVSDNGTLSLPLIGNVTAIGHSPREIAKDIEAKLQDGYLRDPKVSMDVLTYRPFYILGEVTTPGEYAYSNGLSVMNAVARAQGFTYRANKRRIYIKRFGDTIEREHKLTPDVQVYPGDTIRVGERFF